MATNDNHLVIMAGGVGSRLWPISSKRTPKQFVDVLGCGRTLIQLTLERFRGVVDMDNVWVVTSDRYAPTVHEQLPEIPEGNILKEPVGRNTAPCIAYASWKIKSINPNANIVVAPSDHIIIDTGEFRRVIESCLTFAGESDSIVTLGMKPTRPDTGYGYIQVDMTASCLSNKNVFRVDSFREKPDLETAKAYVADNNYYWNAGIFVWNVSTIVNALRVYAHEISNPFERLLDVYGTEGEQEAVDKVYAQCEAISVDYAVLEKADEIFCYPASFGWSDLGTWKSLYDNAEHDQQGNFIVGNAETHDTSNCIIRMEGMDRAIVQGLDGYIVAEKNGSLLICKLTEEQRIRQFVEQPK